MDIIEKLNNIEEIRQVKYRYLRCIDMKLWDDIGDTLTEGAAVDYGMSRLSGKPVAIAGRAEIVSSFRARFEPGILTAHTASQPEITVDGDTATGTWMLRDTMLATRHRVVIMGTAFVSDRYERGADASWRIARTCYLTNYEVAVSFDDLPSFETISGYAGESPEAASEDAVTS
jgi:hypothetical protein